MKKVWIAFSVMLLIAVSLRITQLFVDVSVVGAYFILFMIAALLFVGILSISELRNFEISSVSVPVKSTLCALFGVIAAISMIFHSAYDVYSLTVSENYVVYTFIDRFPIIYLISSVLGFVSAVLFIVTSINNGFGHDPFKKSPGFTVLLPVWYCINLVIEFITSISLHNSLENSLEVLCMVFTLLFLFFHAKASSNVDKVSSYKRCLIYGLPAVIAAFSSSLAYFIAYFGNFEFSSNLPFSIHTVNLSMSFYILFFLIAAFRRNNKAVLHEKDTYVPNADVHEKISNSNREYDAQVNKFSNAEKESREIDDFSFDREGGISIGNNEDGEGTDKISAGTVYDRTELPDTTIDELSDENESMPAKSLDDIDLLFARISGLLRDEDDSDKAVSEEPFENEAESTSYDTDAQNEEAFYLQSENDMEEEKAVPEVISEDADEEASDLQTENDAADEDDTAESLSGDSNEETENSSDLFSRIDNILNADDFPYKLSEKTSPDLMERIENIINPKEDL